LTVNIDREKSMVKIDWSIKKQLIGDTSSNRKNWRLEKIGDSGTKPVILKYCWCTTYCKHLTTAGTITQQES